MVFPGPDLRSVILLHQLDTPSPFTPSVIRKGGPCRGEYKMSIRGGSGGGNPPGVFTLFPADTYNQSSLPTN
jgi:hypothetical protein